MPPFTFTPNPELVSAIDACRGDLTREQFVDANLHDALAGKLPVFARQLTTKSRPTLRIHLDQTTADALGRVLALLDMRPCELLRRITEAACSSKLTNITEAHAKVAPTPAPTPERPKPLPYQKPAERSFIPLSEIVARMDSQKPTKAHARGQDDSAKIEQEPLTEAQFEVYSKMYAELCESIDPREPTEQELAQLLAKAAQG